MAQITKYTTVELLDIADGTLETEHTPAAAIAELKDRIIPEEYEVEMYRGGVRPTHQPLNP